MTTPSIDGARRFEGRRALVVGASGVIGREVALSLAREGATVAGTWFRNRDAARDLGKALASFGPEHQMFRASLQQPDAARELVEDVVRCLPTPELLFFAAASGAPRSVTELTPRQWAWALRVNTEALLRIAQLMTPSLVSVVAVSSYGSTRTRRGYAAIGVSKAALESLSRYLAVELAPGTRANVVVPGVVDSASLRALVDEPEAALEAARRATPAERLTTSEDIARLSLFLLSDDAAMITGQSIVIDGGYSITA